ncbi:hypothetical protein KY386_01735 [Candidatus Parcubacteria bacterium]|nr:hypothetical protein [Candidatus Parcubacteria bacterium]
MDLTPKQQTSEAIRQADSILVTTSQRPSIDQVTAVASLAMILRKLGKQVTAVVSDNVPASIAWLVEGRLDGSPEGLRDFIIQLDLGRAEVDKLKYTNQDGRLNIHVTPFRGRFSQSDVSFSYGEAVAGNEQYDLVIALGVTSRSKLDKLFERNRSLGDVPLLNLDFHRINENYGAVNLIEPNASSLSEMLVSLSESLQTGLIDEPIATALLAGIMASTDRFTANHTTPKALTVAAQLMAAGGKQQQIVRSLYRKDGSVSRTGDRPVGQPSGSKPGSAQPPSRQPAAPGQRQDRPQTHSAHPPERRQGAGASGDNSAPPSTDSPNTAGEAPRPAGRPEQQPGGDEKPSSATSPDGQADYPDFFTTSEP